MLGALDFALRIAFFAIAPFMVIAILRVAPIWGAVINTLLVLGIFYTGERVRSLAGKSRVLGLITRRHLAIEAHYRDNPPKPFVYYLFFPLLMPYWLIKRSALREFMLFRGYNLIALTVIAVNATIQYIAVWRPIGLGYYMGSIIGVLLIEAVVVLVVLMPTATTFISYSLAGKRKRLTALTAIGLASAALGIVVYVTQPPPVTRMERGRVAERTKGDKQAARAAVDAGLARAADAIAAGESREQALAAAREALGEFYKGREVQVFELVVAGDPPSLLLGAPATDKYPPVWRARDPGGRELTAAELPRELSERMARP